MSQRPTTEGRVPYNVPNAGKPVSTWYKIVGDLSAGKPALVLLHGGPGAGHDYLSSLTDIYDKYKIPLVFYDQIGGARSTHFRERMGDEEFWTVDLFIQELDNLVDHLGLRKNGFFVLGQSWGGVLAGSYAARQPPGLKMVVIASGPSDMSLYVEGTRALLAKLPDEARKTIEDCERRGDYHSPEYEAASAVWAQYHVCTLDPWPQPLQDTFSNLMDDPTTYLSM
jgi:proline-specific peptidase